MKAICTRTFLDVETGELRERGTSFDVTPERLSAINSTKYGQLAEEVEEEVSEPQRPKRRTRRKKTEE